MSAPNQLSQGAHKPDLAKQGTSRTVLAHSGTDGPRNAVVTDVALLREELEDIGRNARSMKPSALAGHDMLLNSSDVRRRAGKEPSDLQLQNAAYEALNDAIARLPTPTHRLIAQAVLAATEDFEDKIVNVRKRTLDEKYGIGEKPFKNRRGEVLDLIVEYLLDTSTLTATSLRSSPSTLEGYHAAINDLYHLMHDTCQLLFMWKNYQFVNAVNQYFTETGNWPPDFSAHGRPIFLDFLYESSIDLVVTAGYCLDDEQYSQRERLARYLPEELLTSLSEGLEIIFKVLPFTGRESYCRAYFSPDIETRRRALHSGRRQWTRWAMGLSLDGQVDNTLVAEIEAGTSTVMLGADMIHISRYELEATIFEQTARMIAAYYDISLETSVTINHYELSLEKHREIFFKHGSLLGLGKSDDT